MGLGPVSDTSDHDVPAAAPTATGVTGRIPDDFEQATGLERKELEAIRAGNPVRF